jgi:hypothetical protein
MKFTATIQAPSLGLHREEAMEYIGPHKLFLDMEKHGWIKPVINRSRFVIFDRASLDAAWERVVAGEYPGESRQGA